MRRIDETDLLKKKLDLFEAKVPDFDGFFSDEELGEVMLSNILKSKLNDYKAEVPLFEELIDSKPVMIPLYKRLMPLWRIAAAAVACLAFFLLLPEITKMDDEIISMANKEPIQKTITKKTLKQTLPEKTFYTQALQTPSAIKSIVVTGANTHEKGNKKDDKSAQSSEKSDITEKISASSNNLYLQNEYSVEQAYAQARERKSKEEKGKVRAGLNFNGGNRLLSFVNTRQNSSFPLQSTLINYSQGLSSLSASATPQVYHLLRSASISKNAWKEIPSNYNLSSVLQSQEASYSLPVNFGFTISYPLNSIFEIQSGLTYTYLSGVTSGKSGSTKFSLEQELHYIGLPLRLAVNFHKYQKLGLYASFGGAIEKGLSGSQHLDVDNNGVTKVWESRQEIYGIQPVIGCQLGASYEIAHSLLLYVEPGANYYIPNDQPISSRTEERFNFNLGIGLRFSLN
jgi:hypothetical protein